MMCFFGFGEDVLNIIKFVGGDFDFYGDVDEFKELFELSDFDARANDVVESSRRNNRAAIESLIEIVLMDCCVVVCVCVV